MSNLIKKPKMSAMQKRAAVFSKGYAQGQADLMSNVKLPEGRLNADATKIIMDTAAAEGAVGDRRTAHILRTLIEWCGDPETIKSYTVPM